MIIPRPIGPPVDDTPAPPPGPAVLAGRFGRLEKLSLARHAEALWRSFRTDPMLWDYLPQGPFDDFAGFATWIERLETGPDPYAYAVVDPQGEALGYLTLMAIRPDMRAVEVGHVTFGPALRRTPLATEAQFLLAREVFAALGYRRYEWKCDALNAPSRRAAERLGFTYEGTFRQHMIVKGRNRDTAWYATLDRDWPAREREFRRWLDPANFNAGGSQMTPLRMAPDA